MINLYIKPIYTVAELKSCIFSVKLDSSILVKYTSI